MVISETKSNSKLHVEDICLLHLLLYCIADLVLFFNERVSHCWFLLATNCFSVVLDLI